MSLWRPVISVHPREVSLFNFFTVLLKKLSAILCFMNSTMRLLLCGKESHTCSYRLQFLNLTFLCVSHQKASQWILKMVQEL